MRILIAATYFHPYSSGLSVYAKRIASGLVALGHDVVVLTAQYKPLLPLEEDLDGVRVVRVPVSFRLSKGVVSLGLRKTARTWVQWADVINLHLPQFEAPTLARAASCFGKKLVVTYHCDLAMRGSLLSRLAVQVTKLRSKRVLRQADLIVQNSLDYAQNSPLLQPWLEKVRAVNIPVELSVSTDARIDAFRSEHGISAGEQILGLAGRVATEKGYEYLIAALPQIAAKYPQVRVLHAGAWKGAVGEEAYQARIEALAVPLGKRWQSLGFLSDDDFRTFFGACDLLVFSSLDSTESFGIVQIEAMLQGTPVVASDLPGVRQPVLNTGMGRIVPVGDADGLAEAIISVLDEGKQARSAPSAYLQAFSVEQVGRHYQELFEALVKA